MDDLGPLTLRPGDRRIRAVVHDGPPPGDPWWIERSCRRCGRTIDARSGARVVYGTHDTATPDSAALCTSCAVLLTPFRCTIDLRELSALASPDAVTREVGDLVGQVLAMRVDPPSDVLTLRAADTHALARRLQTTRTHLALRLRDVGVLAGIEVATAQRTGTARQHHDTHAPSAAPA